MKYNKAFTLIEVLVIMMVFCVGILTVLYSITQTITNKEIVKLQLQTSFIGREGIELMYNLRDSNFKKELPWDCLFRNMGTEDSEPCK
ncbi:MAG: type II secretion system GspH family protein [Patescibacteria group bacterium]|nr:type II secretion system GspH family protein [Patescibacteria group bacterium]